MTSKKLLLALFTITGVLIVCYVYLGNTGSLSYGDGVSSASGVLSIGKHIFGAKNELSDINNITSRKPKVDWKEYWRHIEGEKERKIMGFQEETNAFEEINVKMPADNFVKTISKEHKTEQVNKEGSVAAKNVNKETLTNIEIKDKDAVQRPKLNKKKWLYDWNEKKETIDVLPLYGNWQDEMADRIIFNRVGKCGSRSVLDVFKHLAKKNQYNMINSIVYNQTRLSEEKVNLIVSVLLKIDPPFLFQRHMHYVDFSKFSSSSVKYINIIRDPIERFTSQYYFKRFGDGKNDQSQRQFKGTDEEKYQTINECVLKKRAECSGKKLQYVIPFFCGHSYKCRLPGRTPLEIAIENFERDFIVVGILNELEDTFAVLEKLLPRFFNGAVAYLNDPGNTYARNRSATTTKHKESPSEEVRTILLEQMSLEYEFYYYIRDHFHKLKNQLGIGNKKQLES